MYDKKLTITAILTIFLSVVFIAILHFQYKINIYLTSSKTGQSKLAKHDNKPLIKVGDEVLYSTDFNERAKKITAMTGGHDVEDEVVFSELIKESILLQEYIDKTALDETIFNSLNKDSSKRRAAIREADEKLEEDLRKEPSILKVAYISVWYWNVEIGPLGYEVGKELAFTKINNVYAGLKNGKMSLEEVKNMLQNDEEIAQMDRVYKENVFILKEYSSDEEIQVRDEDFKKDILETGVNELTKIHNLKPSNNEGYYIFAKILERSQDKDSLPLTIGAWYELKKDSYEIKYY
jgi:hypothetical protein